MTSVKSEPEYTYHVLRSAVEKFSKGVAELSESELQQAHKQAQRTFQLESKVLASGEAQSVVIQESEIEKAVQELAGRYPDFQTFHADLEANGVTQEALYRALYRELLFDAVMKKVASRGYAISDLDVQIFYQLHKTRFSSPEIRHARHLLITVNEEYEENSRAEALQRIHSLREKIISNPGSFEELVVRHSECPTALQGGTLGKVRQGVLYPQLDEVLFSMHENEISEVVESEVGFHILWCEKIEPARQVTLREAESRIRPLLEERQRRNCQKMWLATLGGSSR